MGPYRHVSIVLFLKRYIFLKGMFVEAFSPFVMKTKPVNFLIESVETPKHFPLLSSLILKHLTRLYHWFRALIFLLIYKNNYLVQSKQQNWSNSISQLVHFWFDKSSPPSEVMYFCESCWMIFSIYIYIVSDVYFPLLYVNRWNLLC